MGDVTDALPSNEQLVTVGTQNSQNKTELPSILPLLNSSVNCTVNYLSNCEAGIPMPHKTLAVR